MNERFHLFTLGCKINQYETHALREAWTALGMLETGDPAEAQVILINTCGVTEGALRDVRKALLRLRRAAPEAEIIVTGCAAETYRDDILEADPDARVVPQGKKELLGAGPHANLDADSAPGFAPFSVSHFDRTRAVLKVQDGCSHRCTYCFVPSARGPAVSRPPKDVLAEARLLLAAGHPEIVLSGINLRQYAPRPGYDFWDLVRSLHKELASEWKGRAGLRFSSIDPGQLGPKALDVLMETMGPGGLVKPHLHLSLQSGSSGVLKRMGRGHYSPEGIAEFLTTLSANFPIFGLGADILVGFPGETQEEFDQTTRFCHYLPLSYAHVFPFSPRPGTKAAHMPDHIPAEEKKRRAAEIHSIAAAKAKAFLQRVAGLSKVEVVYEGPEKNGGRCEYYVACRFSEPLQGFSAGDVVRARPDGYTETTLKVVQDDSDDATIAPDI